jgi:hypothetical protein
VIRASSQASDWSSLPRVDSTDPVGPLALLESHGRGRT